MNRWVCKVVVELILLQVGETDSGEGRKERGTRVDSAVIDRVPYLCESSVKCPTYTTWPTYRPSCALNESGLVYLTELFDGVKIPYNALGSVVALCASTSRSATVSLPHNPQCAYSSVVKAVPCICMRADRSGGSLCCISYSPSTFLAEESNLSWLIFRDAKAE